MFSETLEKIWGHEKIQALSSALAQEDDILVEGLWNSPKALLASLAEKVTGKHILILTSDSQEEARLFHDFPFFTKRRVISFPAWETLPQEKTPPSPDVVGDRYQVLQELSLAEQPLIILSGLTACLQKLIPPSLFDTLYLMLKKGDSISHEKLTLKLQEMGYTRTPLVSDKAEFALRGGIVDIFPVSSPDPYRFEFFGDEIESIRVFDPIGQKSIKPIDEVHIPPAKELELIEKEETLATLFEYLGEKTLVIFDDLLALEDKYVALSGILDKETKTFLKIQDFLKKVASYQKIFLTKTSLEELTTIKVKKNGNYYGEKEALKELSFEMFSEKFEAKKWTHPFETVGAYLLPEVEEGKTVSQGELFLSLNRLKKQELHILTNTSAEMTQFQKKVLEDQILLPEKTLYHLGYLSSGFVLPDDGFVLLSTAEMTHRYKIRRQKQRSTYHTEGIETYQLNPGEMVVHLNHGIGRFLGVEIKPNHLGTLSEYFTIEYAKGGKLYVPIHQSYLITKYIGATEEIPQMHEIGGVKWKRAKETTQKAIVGYAKELLKLYAEREIKGGFSYPEDGEEMMAFEEEFPFVETEDQLRAIDAIKKDMSSKKPMDRLICGDVGYGKTEVAMRACFKAIAEGGKQVALLVPTTVLAMQHFDTFCERMSHTGVSIGVLSRFRTPKQQKETIEGVKNGTIDLVIGTHRIISKDLVFKDLGLIVIDEEQRFGVKAKEHLKSLKTGVDCLTLSATPIPRTLYMSLVGARDLSIISTPPQDRLPITTLIAENNNELIKGALLRELTRDGQAYVIHNRVETIYEYANHIQSLLPQARIAVCHGQLDPDENDAVFHAFRNGQVDILVATTIVESGIDVPNANTILIDRADHFGMSDLYQLRGRVGRWNRRAFAYFLVRNKHTLAEISRKRLEALSEASGYGGGMKIAMRDLELRGAGDILGHEQSGHVSSIGFHFYCKLLKRTIKALQGEVKATNFEVKLEFDSIIAKFPETYVNEVSLRMDLYQRIGEAYTLEEVNEIFEEVQDRFGKQPESVRWLYHLTRIRIFAAQEGVSSLKQNKMSLSFQKGQTLKQVTMRFPKEPKAFEEAILAVIRTP
jgi:transcription-repair coupling factor (superfamily II helicase)